MVQIVDDKGNVLAHIYAGIVGLRQKLRRLVYQVGGEDPVDQAVLVVLVKFGEAVGEESEGGAAEHSLCLAPL